jgi:hypothetical protein
MQPINHVLAEWISQSATPSPSLSVTVHVRINSRIHKVHANPLHAHNDSDILPDSIIARTGLPMRRSRINGGIVSSLIATTALLSSGSLQARAADSTHFTESSTPQHCTPLKATRTRFIGANGKMVAASAAATETSAVAREVTYTLPGGAIMSTIIPPDGFQPLKASPATARAFGFDVPNDLTKLAAWRKKHAGYTKTVPSAPCLAPSRVSSLRVTYGPYWGGFEATGYTNYVEVYDDQNIPTYSSSCGSNSATMTSSWIGLGGDNAQRLIQQGFDAGSSATATTGARLWYEYLTVLKPNPLVYIGSTTRTGDTISQAMTYSSGTVVFHWYDRTNGQKWSDVTVKNLSGYYDGSTADFITEWPPGTDAIRKFSRQTFSAAGAAHGSTFADLFTLPYLEDRVTNTGTSSGALIFSNTKSSSSSFYQDWKRCS